jgi:hypothetical protein
MTPGYSRRYKKRHRGEGLQRKKESLIERLPLLALILRPKKGTKRRENFAIKEERTLTS